jgi:hypothetical protein
MKPEEQRIAIAKACGYRNIALREDPDEGFDPLLTGFKNDNQFDEQIPDYLNSLNAMHEAEKTLSDDQFMDYHGNLGCLGDYGLWWNKNLTHATASKRAEAFLKTIGQWID